MNKMAMRKLSSKSQQETVGFVVIILMVMVIGTIFLGLSLRKSKPVVAIDAELSNFLIASASITTECAKDYESDYKSLGDVMEYCYSNNRQCYDGRKSCEILNETYRAILGNFRPGGTNLKYYRVSFYFQDSLNESLEDSGIKFTDDIFYGNSSGCSSRRGARNYIPVSGGSLVPDMDLCLELE